ncbi:MAG: MarR family transcriptional regulator [Pseudobacteriovorax sp.]|nr:MarR family transcriptional regulator [Pseudobacteriovorax sp.]
MVPENLNEDLFYNLDRATLLMRRHVIDVIGFHQVSPEQWEILQLIDVPEGITQRHLTSLTLKDKGNLSRILARMEKAEWIRRTQLPTGRGFSIQLTSKGKKIRERLPDMVTKQVERLLEPLPTDERTEILYCLKKLRILLGDDDVVT